LWKGNCLQNIYDITEINLIEDKTDHLIKSSKIVWTKKEQYLLNVIKRNF
jgi:hypothetical protein